MRTIVFILSAAAILLFTTCEEEMTTLPNYENSLRTIKILDINSNLETKLVSIYKQVRSCVLVDTITLVYSTNFEEGDEYHGYGGGGKLVIRDLINMTDYNQYFSKGYIQSFRTYPDINSIYLSDGDDLFKMIGRGESLVNLTNSFGAAEESPIYSIDNSLLIYRYLDYSNYFSALLSRDLNTSIVDTLVKSQNSNLLGAIFVLENSNRLIYYELTDTRTAGWIKSVNLSDLFDIQALTDSIPITTIGKIKSVDDKIAFTSAGIVYVLNLNTAELDAIATGAQSACISNDGNKVVYTTRQELFLVNTDGTNTQKLTSKVTPDKYLFLPSFSSDDQKILFLESDNPYD
jgi:hypothetical protein